MAEALEKIAVVTGAGTGVGRAASLAELKERADGTFASQEF